MSLTREELVFLSALRRGVKGDVWGDNASYSSHESDQILKLAIKQGILPVVFNILCSDPICRVLDKDIRKKYREYALGLSIRQIIQTNEFLTLILHAQAQGLDPIVVKGITVRNLYPQPCLRPSVDEDLLILPDETEKYHQFFLSEGLFADDPDVDREAASELSYHKENSPTYIELHKTLFAPQSDAYGDFNALFPELFEHTVRIQIEDVSVRTLAPTDHFLYLILHAFKHFVHSGIGIRSVCDIGMFAEHNRDEINWDRIRANLESAHAFTFGRAMLRIVQRHLMPEAEFFSMIKEWDLKAIDIEPLLEDILASGVHGASSMTRLHSSSVTLNAVANQKKSRQAKQGTFRQMLFPSAKKLAGRYPYLKKAPILLPLAWTQRAGHYLTEDRKKHAVSDAAESLRLGEARIQLLKQYGIIDQNN